MLFDAKTEEMVLNALRDEKLNARQTMQEPLDTALEYANGNMLEDTLGQLAQQYMMRQQTEQPIMPHILPLTAFFVAESALTYQNGVFRTLVHRETGEINEELTKAYLGVWGDAQGDATMKEVDRRLVLLKTTGILPTHEHGKIDLRIVKAHDIFPLWDPESTANAANQENYAGHIIDHRITFGDSTGAARLYTLITPEGFVQYKGTPSRVTDLVGSPVNNPLSWPGIALDPQGRPTGDVVEKQLQMLLIAHESKPTETLFNLSVPAIYIANQGLNVQWSIIQDVFRWQCGSMPVLNVLEPEAQNAVRPVGVNNPLVLQAGGESATFTTANNDYEALVLFLTKYAQTVAMLERMSPDDLALEQNGPESGYAKTLANLPKLRAVESRAKSLIITEKELFKRVAALGVWLGLLPAEIKQYELQVEFEPIVMPMSTDERIAAEVHDLAHGFTTRAKLLAAKSNSTEEEAETQLAENLSANAAESASAEQTGLAGSLGRFSQFGALINAPASAGASPVDAPVDAKKGDPNAEPIA